MGNTELGKWRKAAVLEAFTGEAIRSGVHFCLPREFFPCCLVILMSFNLSGKDFDAQGTDMLMDKIRDAMSTLIAG